MERGRRAFTLIELIAVISILAVLAAVVAPRAFDMSGQARHEAMAATVEAVRIGIAEVEIAYKMGKPGLPPDSDSNGTTITINRP